MSSSAEGMFNQDGQEQLSESRILQGLLEAGRYKDDECNRRTIEIARGGKLLFEFRIRPLSEEEMETCRKGATKYAKGEYGQPRQVISVDNARLNTLTIYTATVDEDRRKVWDNEKARDALNVLTGADVVESVLMAGEKERVCRAIAEISGFHVRLEEKAKNSSTPVG